MREVVLARPVRTPVGKFGRSLRGVQATELGALVVGEAVRRAGIKPNEVDEVIIGNVISAGLGQNPARQAALHAGLPPEVGAVTINKVCGSGLKAVMLAAQAIRAGDAEVIVAGGMESMSNAPYLIRYLRWGLKFGDASIIDSMIRDGLQDAYHKYHMGVTGEIIAEKYGIKREEVDDFALGSNRKAVKAINEGGFKEETIPVQIPQEDGSTGVLEVDECPRPDTSKSKLGKLKPVFKEDGILTAGNSSQLSDGAAAVVLASKEKAQQLGIEPMARVVDYASGGVKPELVMEAPIPTVRALLRKTQLRANDLDLVEHNEAYASASLVVIRELGLDMKKFNVKGGAVALGHPIGCSGARILTTLIYALKDTGGSRGLATLCLGGGNAVAMIVERV